MHWERQLARHGFSPLPWAPNWLQEVERRLGVRALASDDVRSVEAAEADPWSMSGQVGLGCQPWHTDGAVSPRPPSLLALGLRSGQDPVPTELVDLEAELNRGVRDEFAKAILCIRDRRGRARLRHGVSGVDHRLVWDPRVCEVLSSDRLAMKLQQLEPSYAHHWRSGELLLIDNKRVMHRRPSVERRGQRVLRRVYLYDL